MKTRDIGRGFLFFLCLVALFLLTPWQAFAAEGMSAQLDASPWPAGKTEPESPRERLMRYEAAAEAVRLGLPQEETAVGEVGFYFLAQLDDDCDRMALGDSRTLYRMGQEYYFEGTPPDAYIDYFGNAAPLSTEPAAWTVQPEVGGAVGRLTQTMGTEDGRRTYVHFDDWEAVETDGEIVLRAIAREPVALAYVDVSMPLYLDPAGYDYHGSWYYVIKGGSVTDYEGRLTKALEAWEEKNGVMLRGKKFWQWANIAGGGLENVQANVNIAPVYGRTYQLVMWDAAEKASLGEIGYLEDEVVELASLPKPQKAGYVFDGWRTRGGGQVPETLAMGTEEIRLYAAFTKLVTVTFEGERSVQTVYAPEGATYATLRPVEPDLPNGARFNRWVDKKTGKAVDPDKAITREMTLEAEYTHTVRFLVDGRLYEAQDVVIGERVDMNLLTPFEDEAVRIDGWVAQSAGYDLDTPVLCDMTFEAEMSYRVTFVYGMEGEQTEECFVRANGTIEEEAVPDHSVEGYMARWDAADALSERVTSPLVIRAQYAPRLPGAEYISFDSPMPGQAKGM